MPAYSSGPWSGIPFGALGPATPGAGSRVLPHAASTPLIINGDYVIDDDGNFVTGDATTQEVLFLLNTFFQTFVAPDGTTRGNSVIQIRSWTTTTIFEVRTRVLLALKSAIDRGSIKDVEVDVAPYMLNRSNAVLQYQVNYTATGLL